MAGSQDTGHSDLPGDQAGAGGMGGSDGARSDAEFDDAFAALVSDLDLPDLGDLPQAPDSADLADPSSPATGQHDADGRRQDGAGQAGVPTSGGAHAPAGSDEAAAETRGGAPARQESLEEVTTPKAVKLAIVLTPIANADALAALCAMSGLSCWVVPASTGAVAVKELVSTHAEWDVSELLDGADSEPAEAAELAGTLSRLSRAGVVLVTADLATDVGIESGLSGTMTARRYAGGQVGEEVSAGLILASMDQVVEDLLLGLTRAQDVSGAVDTTRVKPSRIMRWLGRGLRGGGQG